MNINGCEKTSLQGTWNEDYKFTVTAGANDKKTIFQGLLTDYPSFNSLTNMENEYRDLNSGQE